MFRSRTVIQFAEFYMPGHKQSHYRRWFGAASPYRIRSCPAAKNWRALLIPT